MLKAIQERISRRTFIDLPLTQEELQTIATYLKELNRKSKLTMEFVENGEVAFSNFKKSYGMFKNVHSLILMKGNSNDQYLKEKIGYYGEELILRLTKIKVATCWVGGTFDKDKLKVADNEQLICVILVGKVQDLTIKEKLIRTAISKRRKPIEERIITDTNELPSWLIEGLKAVCLAPSAKNSQKAKFEYRSGKLYAVISDDNDLALVDLGIAKKHFEIASHGTFNFGNGKAFHLDEKNN